MLVTAEIDQTVLAYANDAGSLRYISTVASLISLSRASTWVLLTCWRLSYVLAPRHKQNPSAGQLDCLAGQRKAVTPH